MKRELMLNPSQVCMLRYLRDCPGVTRGELSRVSWGTVVVMSQYNRVKRLEERGFIVDHGESNKAALNLTKKGFEALEAYAYLSDRCTSGDKYLREQVRRELEGRGL